MQDVTEVRKALDSKKRSEALLQVVVDSLPEFILIKDGKGNIVFANQEIAKTYGLSPEEIIGRNEWEFTGKTGASPEEQEHYFEDDKEVIDTQKKKFIPEETFTDGDGNVVYLQTTKIPLSLDGKPEYVLVLAQNITERKLSEIKLHENQVLLDSINQNINEAIYRSSPQGLTYVNDACVKMFGYSSREELLSVDPYDLYQNPEERERLSEVMLEQGFLANQEVRFKRKDGTPFWGYLNTRASTDQNGQVVADGAVKDISDKKQIEAGLEMHAQMQAILMNIAKKYINLPLEKVNETTDAALQEIGEFFNTDRAYIFELDAEAMTITNTHEWVKGEVSAELENQQGLPISALDEWGQLFLDGREVYIPNVDEMNGESFKSLLQEQRIKSLITIPMVSDGECIGFVGLDSVASHHHYDENERKLLTLFANMMVNIQLRKIRQAERNKLIDQLTAQNERLKEYSFITSHNIRSSVSRIHSLGQLLEQDPRNDLYLEKIIWSIEKLNETISNINQLLHFEKETDHNQYEPYDICEAIKKVLELNKDWILENEVTLTLNLHDQIVTPTIPAYIDSIAHNLISNAIKYGVTPLSKVIKISTQITNSGYLIIVQDHGMGMDLKEHGNKLFKLGSRLHDTSDGQGLGLYMTKRQIKALDGTIDVQSEPYEGTTFTVFLPK